MKKLILLLFAITFQSCHSQNKETMEPKVKKTKVLEIQKIEMSSSMGEVVDGRKNKNIK